MFKFIKQYQAKKKEEEETLARKRQQVDSEEREAAISSLKAARGMMLNKPCPFNENKPCFAECAHFHGGNVRRGYISYYTTIYWKTIFPSCKLWGKSL
jgi:hypothetical protein